MSRGYEDYVVPPSKKATCKICYLCEHTGLIVGSDMESEVHKGFTIGTGKKMYWMIIWHQSGNCTVYRTGEEDGRLSPRWISGDQLITIHFK